MDLVDRYVQAVRSLLPKAQQDDIAAELEEAIRGRIDAREGELGRKLTNAEVEAIIHEFGHPIAAAGRYAPQRHLIGPEIFPYWWLGAKGVVLLAAIIGVVNGFAHTARGSLDVFGGFGVAWGTFWTTGLFLIGLLTVVGAVMEHYKIQPFANWRVADLRNYGLGGGLGAGLGSAWPPRAENKSWGDFENFRLRPRTRRRISVAASLFFTAVFAAMWALAPAFLDRVPMVIDPRWWLSLIDIRLPESQWLQLWAIGLVQIGFQVLAYLVELVDPSAVRRRAAANLVSNAAGAAFAGAALNFTGLLDLGVPSRAEWHAMDVIQAAPHIMELVLVVWVLASAAAALWDLFRVFTGYAGRRAEI
ncbi:MAG TPA: hypothetical protein VG407_11275 [Caulobacteraceae bacterium]|jgi:hypothetical protein|nr:hypothetical protein [Caulobacteraceae bacterium]